MNGWQGLPGAQKWLICFNSISQDQKPHSKLTHSFTTPWKFLQTPNLHSLCFSLSLFHLNLLFWKLWKVAPHDDQVPLTLKSHQQLYLATVPLKRGSQLLLRPSSLGFTLSFSAYQEPLSYPSQEHLAPAQPVGSCPFRTKTYRRRQLSHTY